MAFLLTLLISYLATSLFGYVVHWCLHQPWMGKANTSHLSHHQIQYPPEDFVSKEYRSAGEDDSFKFFAIAAIPLILVPIILFLVGVLPWYLALAALIMEAIMGFAHDYFHYSFHIENHWLSRIPVVKHIFKVWVELHYVHHVDVTANYGIFCFHWDKLFKSFRRSI